jgi:hypothetical protein
MLITIYGVAAFDITELMQGVKEFEVDENSIFVPFQQ